MRIRLFATLGLLAVFCSSAGAQSNDDFEHRLTLSGANPTAVSNSLRATRQAGEPNHAGAGAGRSLWWTWTATTTGTINIGTYYTGTGAPLMRAVGVYTGDTLGSLTEVASSNNLAQTSYLQYGILQSGTGTSINVPVTAGTVYQIAVDALTPAHSEDDGTVVLAINAVPTILSAANTTATTGTSFAYAITATGGATAFAAANLPTGLALNAATGQITGAPAAAGTYGIGLSASGPGGTGTATLTLRVSDPAPATPVVPVVTSAASTRGLVGTAFSLSISATGSPTAYTAANLPPGLSFNAQTGVISGTPTTAGTTSVPVSATGAGGTGTATLTLVMDAGPPPPIITSALAASGTTGYAFSYYIYTNVDSQTGAAPTACTATNLPPGVTLTTGSSNYLSGTLTQAGVYPVPITVTNAGGTRSATVTITVSDPVAVTPTAAAPVLSSAAGASGVVGAAFSYQIAATNAPTAYTAASLPPGLSFDAQKGLLSGTPTSAGTFLVPLTASNGYGASAGTLTVTVAASAAAQTAAYGVAMPVVVSPAAAAGFVGQTLTYGISAVYPGSPSPFYGPTGTWTFSATGLPPGLSVTTASNSSYGYGTISGTPTATGVYKATITVNSPASSSPTYGTYPASTGTVVVTFLINTGGSSVAPVITGGATVPAVVGASTTYYPTASNSPTNYAASGLPPGLSISAASGTVSGKPTAAGTYAAAISASNASGTGTATVTFIVAAQGAAPLITSSATAAGVVGSAFSYTISTSATLTGSNAGTLPPGLSFNASTGAISGTPTQAGVYAVPIGATTATGTANATLTITIASTAAIRPPTINSYAVQQATLGQSFYYYINTDVSATSYAVGGPLPPGLSFTAGNSYISGTPTAVGTYTVPVSATNSAGTGTATVTFIVTNPGVPVFTSACALAATVGQSFSSSVYASNYPTRYTFSGLPPGITQSSSSPGYLTGTPTQAGVYTVPVSAVNSSGTATATLTITVAAAPSTATVPYFTAELCLEGSVGDPFNDYAGTNTSDAPVTALSALPPGLTLTSATGQITGTPTAAGVYPVTFRTSNSAGTAQAVVTFTIAATAPQVPGIYSAPTIIALQKVPFYYVLGSSPAAASYSASGLPSGVSIDPVKGIISGTVATPGTYTIPVTATNSAGQGTATLTLTVAAPAFAVTTTPVATSARVGQAFTTTLTNSSNSASNSAASGLPPGLSINSSTGIISGTPTTAGSYNATTTQTSAYGTVTGHITFFVGTTAPATPVFTSPGGLGGYVQTPFSYRLQATNSPTSFNIYGLPDGLTFDYATGIISGTPTTAGTYTMNVFATNASGTGLYSVMGITIGAASSAPLQVTSQAGMWWTANTTSLSYQVMSNLPLFSVTGAASLPPGLRFSTSFNGTISGVPIAAGRYDVTLALTNGYTGATSSAVVNFRIDATDPTPPRMTSYASVSGAVGSTFSYVFYAFGSTTVITPGSLPAGLSYNASTKTISGTPTTAGTYQVPVSATNAVGTRTGTLTLNITPLPAPVLTSTSNALERVFTVGTTGSTGSNWYINATNSPTAFAATSLPPGLSLNTTTGQFTGTLTTAGTYPVTVSATNSSGTASAVITYVVSAATPAPPTIPYLAAGYGGFVGVPISTVYLSATNSPASYAASGLPPGLTLNTLNGQIAGTPTTAGVYTVNLSATNAAGTGTAVWQVVVNDNSVLYPVFSDITADFGGTVGQSNYYSFYAYAYYGASSTSANTTITVTGLPTGIQVYSSSANYLELSGAPVATGTYPLTFTATAPGGATATMTGTLVVVPAPAPTITSAAGALGNVNNAFSYSLYASNTATAYSAGTLPAGLTLNPSTGQITGTPTAAGTTVVPVSATGPYGTASASVTIRIDPPLFGGLPIITSAAAVSSQDIPGNSPYYYPIYNSGPAISYTITALNGPTAFTAQDLPSGLSFNSYTGLISGTPVGTGVFRVPITATNAAGSTSATLTILSSSPLPALQTGLAYSAFVGGSCYETLPTYFPAASSGSYYYPYSFYGYSTTYDPLVYAAAGLPPGLTINRDSGTITGTATRAGTYPVTLSVANRAGASQIVQTFFVADTAPASTAAALPTFGGNAEAAGFVGLPMTYGLSASGAPSYSASSLPAGLTLDSATGVISGTPTQAGSTSATVYATNSAGTRQATLTLTVEAVPATPTIYTAAATTATIGTPFSYLPATTNYSGMPAPGAYAAGALPAGLSFNPLSGQISGTPAGPAGTYLVPVSVSVGPGLTAGATLTLTVQPVPAVLPLPVLGSTAGASGLVGNPFYYALRSNAFAPSAALPPGLSYDSVTGTLGGYPTAPGTYLVPLSAPDPNGNGANADHLRGRKAGPAPGNPARQTGRRVLSPVLPDDTGGGPSAVLTVRVISPDFSLPRLMASPSGGTVLENAAFTFSAAAVGAPGPAYQWRRNGAVLAGVNGSTLTLDPVRSADTGDYTLTAFNAAGSVTSNVATLFVQTNYNNWQADCFTPQEIASGFAADTYSFSGDGVTNLLKYALGLDPRSNATAALPAGSRAADGALRIQFDRDAGKTDISYLVEVSTDLRNWTVIAQSVAGAQTSGLDGSGNVTETVLPGSTQRTVTVEAAVPTVGSAQFLRLRVTRP